MIFNSITFFLCKNYFFNKSCLIICLFDILIISLFQQKEKEMKIELYQIAIMSIIPMIALFAYLFTKLINFIEKKYDEKN